jgi:hypothetical protein
MIFEVFEEVFKLKINLQNRWSAKKIPIIKLFESYQSVKLQIYFNFYALDKTA